MLAPVGVSVGACTGGFAVAVLAQGQAENTCTAVGMVLIAVVVADHVVAAVASADESHVWFAAAAVVEAASEVA